MKGFSLGQARARRGEHVPEGGVGGVEGRLAVARADEVGHEAVFHRALDLTEHGLAFLESAGFKGEAGQGDEGVAPPRAEPVITCGNHGFAARADEKTVVFAAQMLKNRLLEHWVRRGGGVAFPEGFRRFVQRFDARGHPDGAVRAQAGDECARHEQVFFVVVAPLLFHGIEHLEIPVRRGGEGGALQLRMGNLHEERRNVFVRLEGKARIVSVFNAESVDEGRAGRLGVEKMIDVASVDERAQSQAHGAEFAGGGGVGQGVADEQTTGGAVEHERAQQHDFLFALAAQAEGEGHAVVGAGNFLQMPPSLGMDDAGMQAAGKRDVPPLNGNGIFNRGQKHEFSRSRLHGQETVIPAGVAPRHGAGGVIPQAVGEKPLLVQAADGVRCVWTNMIFHGKL